jgi:hypothetical protein
MVHAEAGGAEAVVVFNSAGSNPFDASPDVNPSTKAVLTLIERKHGIVLKQALSQGRRVEFMIAPPAEGVSGVAKDL